MLEGALTEIESESKARRKITFLRERQKKKINKSLSLSFGTLHAQ